jgi:hypothetical protein
MEAQALMRHSSFDWFDHIDGVHNPITLSSHALLSFYKGKLGLRLRCATTGELQMGISEVPVAYMVASKIYFS